MVRACHSPRLPTISLLTCSEELVVLVTLVRLFGCRHAVALQQRSGYSATWA